MKTTVDLKVNLDGAMKVWKVGRDEKVQSLVEMALLDAHKTDPPSGWRLYTLKGAMLVSTANIGACNLADRDMLHLLPANVVVPAAERTESETPKADASASEGEPTKITKQQVLDALEEAEAHGTQFIPLKGWRFQFRRDPLVPSGKTFYAHTEAVMSDDDKGRLADRVVNAATNGWDTDRAPQADEDVGAEAMGVRRVLREHKEFINEAHRRIDAVVETLRGLESLRDRIAEACGKKSKQEDTK